MNTAILGGLTDERSEAANRSAPVFIRYWGSHFKSLRQAKVMAEEFRELLRKNWKCHLVLERLPEDASWLEELESSGVAIHRQPRPVGKYDWRAVLRIRRLCQRLSADILVCENIHLPPLIGAVAAGVPVRIWIKHAMNASFEESRQLGLKERIAFSTRLSCWLATAVIAVSSGVKRELLELSISDHKIVVRPNPRRLMPAGGHQSSAGFRKSLGYADSDIILLSVGHAVPVKGWDLLIRSFAQAAVDEPRLRLCLVGSCDAPHEKDFFSRIQSEVSRLGLEARVTFPGHVQNVEEFLHAADLFVMPSRSEGCAYALIEALEAGLPCVVTNVGNAADVIQPGLNGFLVDRNDEIALANAIRKVCTNDELRQSLAKSAFVPESIPTLTQYAEGLAVDYESLLHARS